MDLTLRRSSYTPDGIFGALYQDDGTLVAYTLEHAYASDENGGWAPKIPAGVYTCVRGMHQLENMKAPFETFEITNVPEHTKILLHCGNVNADSAGCVLVGSSIDGIELLQSRLAFAKFLNLQYGVDSFQLTVK